jgi:lipopolysaccharide transport protein LptA
MLADLVSRHVEAEGRVAGRFLDQGVWTSLTAARVVADDQPDRRLAEATGNVVAVRQDQELHGDRFVYDRSTLQGAIEGHALLIRGQDSLRADRIDTDLAVREARATGHVLLDRVAQMVHASAEEAAYSARSETAVLAGHPIVVRGRDSLSADQITVNLAEDLVAADGHVQIIGYPQGTGP